MDRDNDTNYVRSASQFRGDGAAKNAVYGDTIGGKSFTDEESKRLQLAARTRRPITGGDWYTAWSNLTAWTIINCQAETADEIAMYREVAASEVG
jgi:hypothetical protein